MEILERSPQLRRVVSRNEEVVRCLLRIGQVCGIGRGEIGHLVLCHVADQRLGHGRAVALNTDHLVGVDHLLVQGKPLLDIVGGVLKVKGHLAPVDAARLIDVFHAVHESL